VDVPVFVALGTGRSVDADRSVLPTVAIDATGSPEVADLARVHAIEGIGDIRTEAIRDGGVLLLVISATVPVRVTFAIVFDLDQHRLLLADVVQRGSLVIAHTDPERAGSERPLWLSVAIDGSALDRCLTRNASGPKAGRPRRHPAAAASALEEPMSPGLPLQAARFHRSDGEPGGEMAERTFRQATATDRAVLDEMTLAGVRHWGHHVAHPDAYAHLVGELAAGDPPDQHRILVWQDAQGIAGFVDLRDREDHVELYRMFLRTELIGHGHGRALWDRAVQEASAMGDRMMIVSDPGATGFYAAMGARAEGTLEPAPGFTLTVFWYDLRG
jgi:GNAT superfamily N-acetyltransferase